MTVETSLQPNTLLRLNYATLAAHFIELLGAQPSVEHVNTINAHLLDLIHSEALPSDIYKIWLPIALKHLPSLLSTALRDPISHHVRAIGIQQVARISRTSSWKSGVWDILGDAEGIRDIVQNLSIAETVSLLDAIAQSIRRPDDDLPVYIEQLAHLFQPENSSRSLSHHLDALLPLCNSSHLRTVLSTIPEARLTSKLLARISLRHPALLRSIATGKIKVPSYVQKAVTDNCVKAMVRSSAPYTSFYDQQDTDDILPGIIFASDLIYRVVEDTSKRVKPSWINPYIHEALRHVCRQKASFRQINHLIENTLGLIAIDSYRNLTELFVTELTRYWSIASFGTATETGSPTKRLPRRQHPSRPSVDDKENLESLLIDVIYRCQIKLAYFSGRHSLFETIEKVLMGIAAEARLPFIKLICRHSWDLQIDLDLPPSEKEKKGLAIWPYNIMSLLPEPDIKELFDRMLLIHGCTEYLPAPDGDDSLLSWPAQCRLKARCEADVALTDDGFPATRAVISEMRKRAEKGEDSETRSYWANHAVETALASGSLRLLNEAIQWSTRFLRDSLVFLELIESHILGSSSSKLLGCAEATSRGRPRTLTAFQQRIEQADDVLMNILALLTKASKEPIDRARATRGLMDFLEDIVTNRWRSLCRYQKLLSASETDLVVLMLDPLIEILLRYDEAFVEFNWWQGGRPMLPCLYFEEFNSPAFLSFMDRLIQRRDELWISKKVERSDQEQEVEEVSDDEEEASNDEENSSDDEEEIEELSDDEQDTAEASDEKDASDDKQRTGFPQGLAVQNLVPSYLVPITVDNPDAIPYTAAKVQAVLFGGVDALMCPVSEPEDENETEVDELEDVIESYVSGSSRKRQNERVLRVWKHYETILKPHPKQLNIFRTWLAGSARKWGWDKASWIIDPPSMPDTSYLDRALENERMKWNPFGGARQKHKVTVPLTVLYCRMQGEVPSTTVVKEQVKDKCGPLQLWASDYFSKFSQSLSMRGCDAVVLSALLFLGTLTNKPPLPEVFPGPETARWPPISLDNNYVSLTNKKVDPAIESAIQALSDGITFVPTHVLHRLIMVLLDNLQSSSGSRYSIILRCAVQLTKLFASTDQPEMGIDVVLRIIQHFPDDSAYHRHLGMISLGKSLHPEGAVRLVQSLAEFVCERLSSTSAFVKITTVKMVVQLVASADFIPTVTSVDILRSIYDDSSHSDVQTEVFSSMLSLLRRDPDQDDESYQFLRKLSLSAVGSNTNDPNSEWTRAEQEGKLPDISKLCSRRNLELFTLTAFHQLPESHRARYVQEVLLPMVDESIAQHNHWMRSLLRHFELADENFDIDFGPLVPDTIDLVLNNWHNYLPASFLLYNRSSALAYITSPAFETINERISTSPKVSSLEYAFAIRHWKEILEFHRKANPFHHLNVLLTRDLQSTRPDKTGITEKSILSEYQHRMSVVAQNPVRYDPQSGQRIVSHAALINGLTSLRRPRDDTSGKPEHQYSRYQLFRDLMRDIWFDIERLREANQENAPSTKLPSAIQLQAKLLPSPHFNPLHPNPVSECAERVMKLIRQCTDPVTVIESHHIDDMMGSVGSELAMPLALKLGDWLDVTSTDMQTCLTVRVVAKLMSKVKRSDIRADEKAERMLKEWKESRNEYISRTAWEING